MTAPAADPHRILVVDDEPNIVDVVSMALRFQGFAVEGAGTGREALVHAHGGSVSASNAPDGGARFVVRPPAAHSQEELRADPAASHPAARS